MPPAVTYPRYISHITQIRSLAPFLSFLLQSLLLLRPVLALAAQPGKAPPFRVTEYRWNGPGCSDDDLKKLEHDPDVEVLLLATAKITDAGIEYLKGMRKLKELSLNDTQITDAGLRQLQLQSHPDLKGLGFGRTRVTDAGLVYVGRMTTLRDLGLNGQTTDAGLKNILPLKRLEGLSIDHDNDITDVGMGYIGEFTNLEGLHLDSDQITDAGMAHLKGLTRLIRLTIRGSRITGAGLASLEGMKLLSDVTICCDRIGDDGVAHLRGCRHLNLILPSDRITDAGLAHLAGMEIYNLAIGGPKVTDAGLKHLGRVKGLWQLDLLRNTIKGSGLRYLKEQPRNVGERQLPQLQELSLSDATDETLKYVAELPHLERLGLLRPKCTDAGWAQLKKLATLTLYCHCASA